MSSEPHDDTTPETASSIPGNWAVPAHVSAAAAGVTSPPRPRTEEPEKGHPFLLLALLAGTALVFHSITVGFLSPDAEVEEELYETAASLPPPRIEDPAPASLTEEPGPVPEADPSFPPMPGKQSPPDNPKKPDQPAADTAATTAKADPVSPAPGKKGEPTNATLTSTKTPTTKAPATTAGDGAEAALPGGDELPVKRKAKALVRRAERRIKLKNYAGASKLIEQALKLSPDMPRGHRARAVVCAQRGDATCAREAYETYLRLAPEAADAPNVRRILELGE